MMVIWAEDDVLKIRNKKRRRETGSGNSGPHAADER